MLQFSEVDFQVQASASSHDDFVSLSESLLFGEDDQDDANVWSVADGDGEKKDRNGGTYKWLHQTMKALTSPDPAVPQVVLNVLTGKSTDVEAVARQLAIAAPGFNVFMRQSTSTRNKATCLTRLCHKSIILEQAGTQNVINSLDQANTVIIDLAFRESFSTSHPSPHYAAVLELVPESFAATSARFFDLVEFLAEEMTQEFQSSGLPVPPWRTPAALRSKWSKATSFDVLVSAENSSMQKPARQQQQQLLSSHKSMDSPRHVVLGFSIQASCQREPDYRNYSTGGNPSMAHHMAMPAAAWQQQQQQHPISASLPALCERTQCSKAKLKAVASSNGVAGECVQAAFPQGVQLGSQLEVKAMPSSQLAGARCQKTFPLESLLLPVRKVKLGGQIRMSQPAALVA